MTTEAEARAQLEAVKKREYDARHNCWAYVLHTGQKRYSDDGEPQGTAGQPILNVLEREGVQDVLCVVTRYFGGILLGAGGSLPGLHESREGRAGRRGHLRAAPVERAAALACPYALFERVKLELDKHSGLLRDADYSAQIALTSFCLSRRKPRSGRPCRSFPPGASRRKRPARSCAACAS